MLCAANTIKSYCKVSWELCMITCQWLKTRETNFLQCLRMEDTGGDHRFLWPCVSSCNDPGLRSTMVVCFERSHKTMVHISRHAYVIRIFHNVYHYWLDNFRLNKIGIQVFCIKLDHGKYTHRTWEFWSAFVDGPNFVLTLIPWTLFLLHKYLYLIWHECRKVL